jgi:hypothetical protein
VLPAEAPAGELVEFVPFKEDGGMPPRQEAAVGSFDLKEGGYEEGVYFQAFQEGAELFYGGWEGVGVGHSELMIHIWY